MYWRILRSGSALRPFALSVLARLPISMAPLGMLLLVQQVQGSYAVAGAVTGAFALGTAVGSPGLARVMDRAGQPLVIALSAVLSGALLAALALSTVRGAGPVALVSVAALAGVAFPPMSPAMRGAWKAVLPPGRLRQAGFALDAVAVETVFVGGPLLLSLLLAPDMPVLPLLVTVGLLVVGGVGYSLTAAARDAGLGVSDRTPAAHNTGHAPTDRPAAAHDTRQAPTEPTAHAAPAEAVLRSRALLAVLAVAAAMAVAFGHIDTSLAATARERLADPAALGLLFTAIAGGSATGGLLYGARHWRWLPGRQLPVLLGAFALALAGLPLLLSADELRLGALLPLLFVAGLPIAPSLIVQQNLVDDRAHPSRAGEAQAWLSSAATTGAAAGTALCGVLLDVAGLPWAFAAAAIAAGCSAVIAAGTLLGRSRAGGRSRTSAAPNVASASAAPDTGGGSGR